MDTNKPDSITKLTAEIFAVTLQLQLKSPTVYLLLDETPLHQFNASDNILLAEYLQYLETIKVQLHKLDAAVF